MGYQLVPGSYVAHKILCVDRDNIKDEQTGITASVRTKSSTVLILERQVEWRIFRPAKKLINLNKSFYFSALNILSPYIEMYGQLTATEDGEGSGAIYRRAFNVIFSQYINNDLETTKDFYRRLRCGLVHNGITDRIFVSHSQHIERDEPFWKKGDVYVVNIRCYFEVMHKHFRNYCNMLANGNTDSEIQLYRIFNNKFWPMIEYEGIIRPNVQQ